MSHTWRRGYGRVVRWLLLLVGLTGCALEQAADDVQQRRASALAASRPRSGTPVSAAYCQWRDRCGTSDGECWSRVSADTCDRELADMCRGEIAAMGCRDGLSVRCEECFAD